LNTPAPPPRYATVGSLSSILKPVNIQTDKVLLNGHTSNKTHEQHEELIRCDAQRDITAELRVSSTSGDILGLTTVYR
jgi:hypothetical protein